MNRTRHFPSQFVERYSQFIPDLAGFLESMQTPLRKTVRVNTLKAAREQALTWLEDLGPEPLPWYDLGLTINDGAGIGKRLEHFLGIIHVQEAASMVPALVLEPRPGETALDLTAAPGSKTTQMAAMMQNSGLVIANDSSRKRVRALIGNVDRAGCLNVVICCKDGAKLAAALSNGCDRVLVDAPCTCEGTIRKSAEALDLWSLGAFKRFSSIQKGLVTAGYGALRPGGRMVYSTCTIAPEENEAVVSYLLSRFPEAELLPFELPGLVMRPALRSWAGKEFPGSVANCRRILPQDNDTEAFFLALVRKPDAQAG